MSDCIIPTKKPFGNGYVYVVNGLERVLAHRKAYAENIGTIPAGYVVHHRCENRACINPEHLEAMPRAAHTLLHDPIAASRAKTHCVHGHELSEDNLYHYNGSRHCRTCAIRRARDHKRKRRAERAA